MGAAYSSLGRTKFFLSNFLRTLRCKSQVPAKETECLSCYRKKFLKCADPAPNNQSVWTQIKYLQKNLPSQNPNGLISMQPQNPFPAGQKSRGHKI